MGIRVDPPQRTSLFYIVISALVLMPSVSARAASKMRPVKQVVEYRAQSPRALAMLEVEVTGAEDAAPVRQSVTDAALFVAKPGGDARAALTALEGAPAPGGGALFNVRLFVVAGGTLYTAGRGRCGGWQSDVARCSSSCQGGAFAIRRNGAAPLELMVGAIPGGAAGEGPGIPISPCGLDDETDARLVVKSGRGLAVTGFVND